MVTRCCGFYEGLFLKASSLSSRMQKFRMRARADAINWLRDQPFEQGMIIVFEKIRWCFRREGLIFVKIRARFRREGLTSVSYTHLTLPTRVCILAERELNFRK